MQIGREKCSLWGFTLTGKYYFDYFRIVSRHRSARHLLCTLCLSLCLASSALAGPSGNLDLDYTSTELKENGEKIASQDRFFRNGYFRFDQIVTPVLSYQLSFRTNWLDTTIENQGSTVDTYDRAIEPTADIYFRSSIYDVGVGYRRLERWRTAHLSDEGKRVEDYAYARFTVTPYELPMLSLQVSKLKEFDHYPVQEEDRTNTQYMGLSTYELAYKDMRFSYNVTYAKNEEKTPLDLIYKTKNDTFSGLYKIEYGRTFLDGRATVNASYQGNYIRNKSRRYSDVTGTATLERTAFRGLYASCDSLLPPDQCISITVNPIDVVLNIADPRLVDNNLAAGVTNLNIGKNGKERQHIGIDILTDSAKPVDRLVLYVNGDIITDTVLRTIGNWQVFRSDSNLPATWSSVTISGVSVLAEDSPNNIYRYEIRFAEPQTGRFFKVVNLGISDNVNDIFVTELEVYGPETIGGGEDTTVNTFFNQELNIAASLRPVARLRLDFSYFVNRTDNQPDSVPSAIGGLFANVVSNSLPDNGDTTATLLRSYNAAAAWESHRYLTTTLRFSRIENFDNRDTIDLTSNTYSLTFTSSPLPTLDTNLTLIRTDNSLFGDKDVTSKAILLNVGAKLYKDLRVITDVGWTKSHSYTADTRSNSRFIRGTIDAQFSPRLYATLIYGFERSSSDNGSTHLRDGRLSVTYRPGRNINITAAIRHTSENGKKTTSPGLFIDWLPVPTVRLNAGYEYTRSDRMPERRHTFSTFGTWYVTKFIDVRISYSYTKEEGPTDLAFHSLRYSLNSRFW